MSSVFVLVFFCSGRASKWSAQAGLSLSAGLPMLQGRFAHAVLPAQLFDWHAAVSLLQNADDLLGRESFCLHVG